MKLPSLLEGHESWYQHLGVLFDRAFARGDFASLSSALGHDPDDDDALDPDSLREDPGGTWDWVREELMMGRGSSDVDTISGVLTWLGADGSGLDGAVGAELYEVEIPRRILAVQ